MVYSRFSRKRVARRRPAGRRATFGRRIRRGVTRRVGTYNRFGGKLSRFQPGGRGPELKVFDNICAENAACAVGVTHMYSPIVLSQGCGGPGMSQGTGLSNRLGNRITLKHFQLRCSICPITNSATVTNEGYFRIYLVLDTQCNGAVPALGDIWSYIQAGNVATGVLSPYVSGVMQLLNPSNTGRFRILKTKILNMRSATPLTANFTGVPITFDWNLKMNIPIEFSSTTGVGTISTIKTNNLYVIFTAPTLWGLAYSMCTRVRFSDQ